jgi:hypothetical protein
MGGEIAIMGSVFIVAACYALLALYYGAYFLGYIAFWIGVTVFVLLQEIYKGMVFIFNKDV